MDQWQLTLDSPGLVGAQHDVDHEGELGGALAERLDEPQHAEVMRQVDSILGALLLPPPDPEALPYGRDVPAGWNACETRLGHCVQPEVLICSPICHEALTHTYLELLNTMLPHDLCIVHVQLRPETHLVSYKNIHSYGTCHI